MNGTTRGGGVGEPPALGVRRVHVFISGKVQGVQFRQALREQAEHFQVRGWTRNTKDGRVEAVFEGTDYAVNHLLSWCHRGPEEADVRFVEVQEEAPQNDLDLKEFKVVR